MFQTTCVFFLKNTKKNYLEKIDNKKYYKKKLYY